MHTDPYMDTLFDFFSLTGAASVVLLPEDEEMHEQQQSQRKGQWRCFASDAMTRPRPKQ